MEYIFTFKNTNFAIKAEQLLLEKKLNVKVMPLPSKIKAGCGICLRIIPEEFEQAFNALKSKDFNEIGLFKKIEDGGNIVYIKIEDGSTLWNKG